MGNAIERFMFQPPTPYNPSNFRDISMMEGVAVRIFTPCTLSDKNEWIVYCHANATNITQIGVNMQRLARATRRKVIAVEYPGYSTVTPEKPSARDSVVSVTRICNMLREKNQKIILIGRSIGSGVASQVVKNVYIDLLVLISPFQSMEKMVVMRVGQPLAWMLAGGLYDSEETLKRFKNPVLLMHGDMDTMIPCVHSIKLRKVIPNSKLAVMPNIDHNNLPWEFMCRDIADFINKHM